jgi:hypothetical protein
MTRLRDRKTRLECVTEATRKHRRRYRDLVATIGPYAVAVRLAGCPSTRVEVPWESIYELGCKLKVQQVRAERAARKQGKR